MYSLIELKTLVSSGRDPARSLPLRRGFLLIPLILACFAFLPQMQAQTLPPETDGANPDGCYINFATAEGCGALNGNQPFTGVANTAIGWRSLFFSGSSDANTGVGAGTLALNTGIENTATGAGALLLNLGANNNTANGAFALFQSQLSFNNTAVGAEALFFNDFTAAGTANNNTAVGWEAMEENVNAARNTAVGSFALQNNDFFGNDARHRQHGSWLCGASGIITLIGRSFGNTAVGSGRSRLTFFAVGNTAVGDGALLINDFFATGFPFGFFNDAVGAFALNSNTDGFSNNAFGNSALLL